MSKKTSALLLLLALILIFKKFFLPGPLVWGDAPYFYKEGLKELIALPQIWTTRGNTFGAVNLFIWIYPLMVIYGILGNWLHLGNDIILRLLFYFPSIIFGLAGIYRSAKYIKLSDTAVFFATLIYIVNTHFLLIIDGGQVGLVLAYGIFPIALYSLIKFADNSSVKNFLIALACGFVLTIVDFRVSFMCLFASCLLLSSRPKRVLQVLVIAVCLLGLSSYWIIPALSLPSNTIATNVSGLQTTSLVNSLFLFSPNWPSNQFGQVMAPYFYFVVIPVLIFAGVFMKSEKKYYLFSLIFLIFAFLSKGTTPPIGNIYNFLINTKLGSVLRDSTKFFIPLTFFTAILIGISVETISGKVKNKKTKIFFQFSLYIFILFLVWQAIFGRLNGTFGKNPDISDFQKIYNLVSQNNNFMRIAWFTEKSPFAYHTEEVQSLDAKDLVNFRPFASINNGTSDRFNFMNNSQFLDWFNIFGIKYMVLSGNPRVTNLSESEKKDWNRLADLFATDKRLQKVDIGAKIPIYENPSIHPNKFYVDTAFVVIGSDNIYEKLKEIYPNFSAGNSGFLFTEDGKFDPSLLQNIASTSAVLIYNDKTPKDFEMSFLKKYFVGPTKSARSSQWAIYSADQYLDYKYQLLIRGVAFDDFDYGLGIAFSTIKGEKLAFNLDVPSSGNYILAIRTRNNKTPMRWEETPLPNLKKGKYHYTFENKSGFEIINAVALIPEDEMKAATRLEDNILNHFANYDISNKNDAQNIEKIIKPLKWEPVINLQVDRPKWLIFTDSFNNKWEIQNDLIGVSQSVPMYSAVNGFYIDPKWTDDRIYFKGSDQLRWGIYVTVVSALVIILCLLWIVVKDEKMKARKPNLSQNFKK